LKLPDDFFCPDVAILAPAGFANLRQGQWAQQRGGIALWTLLAVHLVITLMARKSQSSSKRAAFFMYSDDAKSYNMGAVLRKLIAAGRNNGKSSPKMMLVFAVHVVMQLKVDYDYDELCKKDLRDMIRTLVFYKMMTRWATATMGFSDVDVRLLRHGNAMQSVNQAERQATAQSKYKLRRGDSRVTDIDRSSLISEDLSGGLSLSDDFAAALRAKERLLKRRQLKATRTRGATSSKEAPGSSIEGAESGLSPVAEEALKFSKEAAALYKAFHPLYKLMLSSMSMLWIFQIVALLDVVFGSLMISAAFYGISASPNVPGCEGADDLLSNLFRDMLVTLGSTIISLVPLWLIMLRRDRAMPRDFTERQVQQKFRKWFLKDVAIILSGLLWFAFCVLYIILFLANVSQKDADHWLISVVTRCVTLWIILPIILTILWMMIMMLFELFSRGNFIENCIGGLLKAVDRGGEKIPGDDEDTAKRLRRMSSVSEPDPEVRNSSVSEPEPPPPLPGLDLPPPPEPLEPPPPLPGLALPLPEWPAGWALQPPPVEVPFSIQRPRRASCPAVTCHEPLANSLDVELGTCTTRQDALDTLVVSNDQHPGAARRPAAGGRAGKAGPGNTEPVPPNSPHQAWTVPHRGLPPVRRGSTGAAPPLPVQALRMWSAPTAPKCGGVGQPPWAAIIPTDVRVD
jgi:hypothetical protein